MKDSQGPGFISEPQIQYLQQLLAEIRRGHLLVPRFQRPFVWTLEQRLELMNSIRDSIPIGTIMVWRTHRKDIATHARLGPHQLSPVPGAEGAVRQYLLDGVQRLSTLYGALYSLDRAVAAEDEESDGFAIYYDLKTGDFVTPEQETIKDHHIPLSLLLDSVGLLKFQRKLQGDDAEALVERADEIARAFREYKIPIIPISTDDLELATRTLQRVNSQGTVMSEVHMVNALTWTSSFDLLGQIVELKEEKLTRLGWRDLDDDVILKSCKATLELDLYNASVDELSSSLRKRPEVLAQSVESLARAAEFLARQCQILGPSVLPYSLQVVLLANAFRQNPSPSLKLQRLLRDWFWMTTYGELFAGITDSRLNHVIQKMRDSLQNQALIWPGATPFRRRPLPPRFDMRSARGRAIALRLAEEGPVDSQGQAFQAPTILAREGAKALIHLIPRKNLPSSELYASPANRLLARPEDATVARQLLSEGKPDKDFLQSHLISTPAHKALAQGAVERFLQLRMKTLDDLEERFIKSIKEQLA